jgi:rRNA-processing protein FCF1
MSSGDIFVDTNSLIYAIRNRVDIRAQLLEFPEIRKILIPQCVLDELVGLSTHLPEASGALKMASKFQIVESEGSGDDCILNIALAYGAAILTNDRELTERARSNGIRTFSIRGKSRIDISS